MRRRPGAGDAPRMGQGENPPAVMEYLAECLWPGVTQLELTALATRARRVAEDSDGEVRYAGSILMPEDEVVFFVFGSSSPDAVAKAAAAAGIPFERIVEAVRDTGTTERKST